MTKTPVYIADKTKRFCSFTKRRRGLQKLVDKLHEESGDEMFIVIQSQHGNTFSLSTDGFESLTESICEGAKKKRALGCSMQFGESVKQYNAKNPDASKKKNGASKSKSGGANQKQMNNATH